MFDKPTPEQFADEDGYIDYYEYDMALDQWHSQFPDLRESWCGEPKPEPEPEPEESLHDLLSRLLSE